ncbi:hypothetical protein MRX96_059780 [Rhipicephalus microplus]
MAVASTDAEDEPQIQAGHNDKIHQENTNDPPRTKNLLWFCSEEEEDAYKSANGKCSSQSYLTSSGQKPCSPPKRSAPTPPLPNLHPSSSAEGAKSNDGNQGHTQQASSHPTRLDLFAAVSVNRTGQKEALPACSLTK